MLNMMMKRRSIRKFKDLQIEKHVLDRILQGALTAPSSKNKRPWELVVVDNREALGKLGKSRGSNSAFIAKVPLAIIIVSDASKTDVYIEDSAIIAVIIQLLAESEGLGSCWVQVRNRFTEWNESVDNYIKSIFNIPRRFNVECIIALGYPNEIKCPHNANTLSFEKIHYGGF